MEKSILNKFVKYVSLNILGMVGLSCYILADTFFVAKALGATGIAALNFSISVYSVIHGTGLMIGIGGATRYGILKSQSADKKSNKVFTTCVKLGALIGVIYAVIGILGSKYLALLLGADSSTLLMTKTYLRTILCFAPFFILNNVVLAFVRNDTNPNLAMSAMLIGSLSNVILDYIFMFPFGMGMFGAAFATGLAPIISIVILSIHFLKRKNNFRYIPTRIFKSMVSDIVRLGLSAFITEISSAVVLITFNLIILKIKGNLGVASYGIVANIALVGISIFTGIAQGIQPLISSSYGLENYEELRKIKTYAIFTSLSIATVIYVSMFFNADMIINLFNNEQNLEIVQIAKKGIEVYFLGFFFAGINIIMAMYLSATEHARDAFMVSMARGCIIIVPLVIVLSGVWKMNGVWLAFVLTEFIVTMGIILVGSSKNRMLLKSNSTRVQRELN